MKIAYFIGALNRGGAESLILDICRQHKSVPYDFVCVYRHEGNMSEDFKKSGANLIHVPKKSGYIRYLMALRQVFMRESVTIVHSQTPSNTLLLSIALIGTGIKIITTFHGYNFGHAPLWKRRIVYAISQKVLFVSNHQKQYYEQKWNLLEVNKLRVVYNGIDFIKIDSAEPRIDSIELRAKIQEPQKIRLTMVGNFVSVRSQNIIVKSIHSLLQQGICDFDFYFIGRRDDKEGWRYDNCVKYAEEHQLNNIHFLGSRGDVPELLKTMDGFVYSTEHDTFGIAVIEAIAAGLPIVVNDWPVMIEVCNLGLSKSCRTIRFFKTNDVEDCAEKIKGLLLDIEKNKQQLQSDCQLAVTAAKQKYSIQKYIENLYAVYQSL